MGPRPALVAVAVAWAATAVLLAARRPREPAWAWCAAGAGMLTGAFLVDAALGLVPLAAAAITVVLPDGSLRARAVRTALAAVGLTGVPLAVVIAASARPGRALIAAEAAVVGSIALVAYVRRCRAAEAVERARLQWAGWGAMVAGAAAAVVLLAHVLVGWPDAVGVPMILSTVFVPLALVAAAFDRLALRVDRLLVATIETAGLAVLVGVVYAVVVLGFGDAPTDASRRVLGLSMLAAAVATVLFVPARDRLAEFANRRVYGDRRAPDEPLRTFGARMSRAIPLDELLLQLAESLKKSMQLARAEVWIGTDGVLELAASVPYREAPRLRLRGEEVAVIARAHVSGNAWIQVWLPELLSQHPGYTLRVAPLVHSGELLGLVVCSRAAEQAPFADDEERVLTELARQVALALHNSVLDTALQASLKELRVANEEIRASRARIVATADQSRRQIERNLHDGAQQHLVALAVKLGLARQLLEGDRDTLAALLDELRADAQATLTELRELAHGIYPPLLMDRGLPEALQAAANRCPLDTEVAAPVGRFPAEVEAAAYFCCLEALQNAAKHAGPDARVTVTVAATDHQLSFEVADDGAGFDATGSAVHGHGFVNMADRLGAIGGTLTVRSAPGGGTCVRGEIPLTVRTDERPPAPA